MAMSKTSFFSCAFKDYAPLPAYHLAASQIAPYSLQKSASPADIIISIPHGGFHYCEDITPQNSPFFDRMRSLEDSGTSLLKDMIEIDNCAIISAELSRALIDLNRPATALDPQLYDEDIRQADKQDRFARYIQAGYGVAPRLCAKKKPLYDKHLTLESTKNLIDRFHKPYHDKLANLLSQGARHYGQVILLDIHSMPSHYAGKSCPDFVFGDHFGRCLPVTMREAITEHMKILGVSCGWNHPYAGGYITTHYGDIHGPIYALQIEINRALYTKADHKVSGDALKEIAQILGQLVSSLRRLVSPDLAAE